MKLVNQLQIEESRYIHKASTHAIEIGNEYIVWELISLFASLKGPDYPTNIQSYCSAKHSFAATPQLSNYS